MSPETFFRDLFAKAGITIDGNQPWDIQARDPRVYSRMLRDGTIGFGEILDRRLDRLRAH